MADLRDNPKLRTDVLVALIDILDGCIADDIETFTVTRTNDRKGYRSSRPYVNFSPYQSDPKTRISIEVELDDDSTPSFQVVVNAVKDFEAEGESKSKLAAARVEVELAHDQLLKAQQEYARVRGEA